MIIGKWNKSVILTYIGVVFSIMGFILSSRDIRNMRCNLAGITCDCLTDRLQEEYLARRKLFGIELDSMADVRL